MKITGQQIRNAFKYLRLEITVSNGRVKFSGKVPNEIYEAIEANADYEVELILKDAKQNPDLLDTIKERASIRWSEGLSDSLYNAVLSGIQPTGEKAERDAEGKIILRPVSDWGAELEKY